MAETGGAKLDSHEIPWPTSKKACVALARRLAVIMHRMLITGEPFRWPSRKGRTKNRFTARRRSVFRHGNSGTESERLRNFLKIRLTSWLVEQRLLGNSCPEIDSETTSEVQKRKDLRVPDRADGILRADPRTCDSSTRGWRCQAPEHDSDHSETDKGDGGSCETLEVADEAPVAADPGEHSLHYPPFRENHEAVRIGALDDFQLPAAGRGAGRRHPRPLVAAVGDDGLDEGERTASRSNLVSQSECIGKHDLNFLLDYLEQLRPTAQATGSQHRFLQGFRGDVVRPFHG